MNQGEFDLTVTKLTGANGELAAAEMLRVLKADGGWMSRRDFAERGWKDRLCRAARQHSKGTIIFGQRGYRATECATLPEIQGAATVLLSQARAMEAEATELWRVIHGRATVAGDSTTAQS